MNDSTGDPLAQLLVDDFKAEDREKLASLLKGLIFFSKEGDISFTETFSKLPNLEKMEVIFVADKARFLLFSGDREEGLAQKDLIVLDIMPKGSVKFCLKKLADKKKVLKSKNGSYYIPNYRLSEIYERYKK